MNHQYGCTDNTAGKKEIPPFKALALAVGLVLAFPCAAALAPLVGLALAFSSAAAWAEVIPGVDIIVQKKPDGVAITTPTGPDGTYKFTGLERGEYDLFVGDQRVIRVINIRANANGSITGVLSREPDGTARITFNGQSGSVDIPTAPVVVTRSNKKAGVIDVEPDDTQLDLPGAPINTSRSNKKAGLVAGDVGDVNGDLDLPGAPVITSRSNKKAGVIDVKPDDTLPSAISTSRSGIKKPDYPEDDPGISGYSIGGREGDSEGVDTASSQADPLTDGLLLIRDDTASSPKDDGAGKLPGTVKPIQGTPVGLEGDPWGTKVSAKTDEKGAFQFSKLPAGKYKLTLPGQPAKSVSVGTDGTFGGTVMHGSDGGMRVFDRVGNLLLAAPAPKSGEGKPDTGGFGSGNTPGGGGPGAMLPGAGPGAGAPGGAMGPGSPGAGAGGPGSPMIPGRP